MNRRWPSTLPVSILVLSLSSSLFSHEPAPDAGSGTDTADDLATYAQPTNLTVLPKNIPAPRLKALMKRYGEELGVQCEHCHVEDAQSHRFDYASDDNPKKQTARLMMTMLSDINTKYLSQLGDPRYATHLTCGNCHQGQTDPPAYEPSSKR